MFNLANIMIAAVLCSACSSSQSPKDLASREDHPENERGALNLEVKTKENDIKSKDNNDNLVTSNSLPEVSQSGTPGFDPFDSSGELNSTIIGNGSFPEMPSAPPAAMIIETINYCILSQDVALKKIAFDALNKALKTWLNYISGHSNIPQFVLGRIHWLEMRYTEDCSAETRFVFVIGEKNEAIDDEISKAKAVLGKEILALSGVVGDIDPQSPLMSFVYFDPERFNGYQLNSDWLTVILLREIGLLLGLPETRGTVMEDRWDILIDPTKWQNMDVNEFLTIDQENQLFSR